MRLSLLLLTLAIVSFSLSGVHAELFITHQKDLYNVGDFLNATVSIKELTDTSGLLQIGINCPSNNIIFYANYLTVKGNTEKKIAAQWPIADVIGSCTIESRFGSDLPVVSNSFVVTDRIDVSLELNKHYLNPEEPLTIKGTALKANGRPVQGFAEISLTGGKEIISVTKGAFFFNYSLQSDMAAGEYEVSAHVFEKNSEGDILNQGFDSEKFSVSSVPVGMNITFNDETFIPGMNLTGKVNVYDQSGLILPQNATIIIHDGKGREVWEEVTAGSFTYPFSSSSLPGEWTVEAYFADFKEKRFLYVKPHEEVSILLQDKRLFVKNIGNVVYDNHIEIRFLSSEGEKIEVKQLHLQPEEEAEFILTAPEGTYDLSVSDRTFASVPLTGQITAALEVQKGRGLLQDNPLISFIVFISLTFVLVFLSAGFSRKRAASSYYAAAKPSVKPSFAEASSPSISAPVRAPQKPSVFAATITPVPRTIPRYAQPNYSSQYAYPSKKAESTVIIHGAKQTATVLVVKEKNLHQLRNKLEPIALAALRDYFFKAASSVISQHRGVYQKVDDATVLAIFSSATRQFRHEMTAAKAALDIQNSLNAYNRKLKDRLEFGIGIHSGELVLKAGETLQYASVSNTIAVAKRVADKSLYSILTSYETYRRISGDVKGARSGSVSTSAGDIDVYSIAGLSGREAYQGYVAGVISKIKNDRPAPKSSLPSPDDLRLPS